MGKTITRYKYRNIDVTGLPKPVIYCFYDEKLCSDAVSLNVPIANELLSVRVNRRSFRLPGIVDAVIMKLPDGCIVKDIDVLFNPEYQIDVLQLLVASCRKKPFNIIWPGAYADGKLIYSESGYPDFKQFNLEKYDVTCVI